jgi:hypothetical protein
LERKKKEGYYISIHTFHENGILQKEGKMRELNNFATCKQVLHLGFEND